MYPFFAASFIMDVRRSVTSMIWGQRSSQDMAGTTAPELLIRDGCLNAKPQTLEQDVSGIEALHCYGCRAAPCAACTLITL